MAHDHHDGPHQEPAKRKHFWEHPASTHDPYPEKKAEPEQKPEPKEAA